MHIVLRCDVLDTLSNAVKAYRAGDRTLIMDGLNGNRPLAEEVAGTFTPTDRSCNRSQCHWEGTFDSDDTITRPVWVARRREGPAKYANAASIDNVLLVYSDDEPAVYTRDFSPGGSIVKGVVLAVVSLTIAVLMIVVKRRHVPAWCAGAPRSPVSRRGLTGVVDAVEPGCPPRPRARPAQRRPAPPVSPRRWTGLGRTASGPPPPGTSRPGPPG